MRLGAKNWGFMASNLEMRVGTWGSWFRTISLARI